jgi:hypothetical protein
MPKILIQIDTDDLLEHTTVAQDREVFREFLDKIPDEMLVEEVVNRSLLSDVFCESRRTEQQELIDEWADDFGYTKEEEN